MDLQLRTSATMTARLPKMEIISMIFASLALARLFFWDLIICSFDKGKLVERRGRKAVDLQLRTSATMTARLPKASEDIRLVNLSAFIEKENQNGIQISNNPNSS